MNEAWQDVEELRLSDFLRTWRGELVERWSERVRALSPARALPHATLVDHLPMVVDRIAGLIDTQPEGRPPPPENAPEAHAIDRLTRGFDLDEVVQEYAVLRQSIFDLWESKVGGAIALTEMRRLDAALDQSVSRSAVQFARARERLLKALDRIADAALGNADVDTFLQRLVRVTVETAGAAHTVAVLLLEDGVLRLRASSGFDELAARGFSVAVGEGFAGLVAAEGRPLMLREADRDPRVHESLRETGIKALYGVPLIHAGQVIGVAHMGSLTAHEFSDEDQLLFRSVASRATEVIVQAQLVALERQAHRQLENAHAQLMETSALLDTLLARAPVGFAYLDHELRYVRANQALAEMHGRPLGQQIGHKVSEVLPPALGEEVAGLLQKVLATGAPVVARELTAELPGRPPGTRHLLASYYPVPGPGGGTAGVGAVVTDITERKQAEDVQRFLAEVGAILVSSLDYQEMFQQLARLCVPRLGDWCAVDVLDDDGQLHAAAVAHVDPARQERVQYLRRRYPPRLHTTGGAAQVLRTGASLFYPEVSDDMLGSLAYDPEHALLVREVGLDAVMLVPLLVRGRAIGVITFALAGSGRHYVPADLALAEELARRASVAADNARLYREAQHTTRLREQVLAIVSHDLKNPLAVVSMSAAVLARRAGSLSEPRARKVVEAIQRAVSRMDRLIADLLDMASVQAGRLAVERQPFDAVALLTEVMESHEPLAHENGIEMRRHIPEGELVILGDRARLDQVLSNVLGNAIKFSPAGEVITVSAQPAAHEALFAVGDRGPGIPADELGHIFEPYWSVGRNAQKSTGLGLFIAKGIVEAHGGRIWAESEVGVGTIVYFTIPRPGAEPPAR